MTSFFKKSVLLLLSVCLLVTATSCGKTEPADATTEPEKTTATVTAAQPSSAEEESSAAVQENLSPYPVNLLGQSVKACRDKYTTIDGDTYFENACQYELRDLFPGVRYLTTSVEETENSFKTEASDAVFETLYTSSDTELYPGLKTGLTYREYAREFTAAPCVYRSEYCSYSSSFRIDVNGKTATVYLFFFHADSICRSIIITLADSLNYATLNINEAERANYPAAYIGQNALDMQQTFSGVVTDVSGYDTEQKKHMYLGIIPEEPAKPISQDAQVIGVHLFSDEWEAVPGIRNGDSAPGAGFTKHREEEGDSYYYSTFLIGGFFAETYVMVQDDNFAGFEFLCKQLYEN